MKDVRLLIVYFFLATIPYLQLRVMCEEHVRVSFELPSSHVHVHEGVVHRSPGEPPNLNQRRPEDLRHGRDVVFHLLD